jgi:hypothetical protein
VKTKVLTGSLVYLRFHGFRGLYNSSYSIDDLNVYAWKIAELLSAVGMSESFSPTMSMEMLAIMRMNLRNVNGRSCRA